MINIVCTGKPGDGLLRYGYEHCCYLNSVGIKSQVIIIPNPKHTKEDYIKQVGWSLIVIKSRSYAPRDVKIDYCFLCPLADLMNHQLAKNSLKVAKINAKIFGREKKPYSIWKKMKVKSVNFSQLSDIMGFTILLNEIDDCYEVLGLLHQKYSYVPGSP